jgi:predicted glycogen debranching enzyme
LPGYNTADATLWYVLAIAAYEQLTGDGSVVDELLPVLRSIVDWHIRGTRFGIGMDPADGLLRAGEPGLQLTWMDAKIGDWVVTPRVGKPVELQALWYNVLRHVAAWWATRARPGATELDALAERTRASFRTRFVRPSTGSLADVVDGPDGDDLTARTRSSPSPYLTHFWKGGPLPRSSKRWPELCSLHWACVRLAWMIRVFKARTVAHRYAAMPPITRDRFGPGC